VRAALVLLLLLAATACGGEQERGTATLWVTRDRGVHVLYTGTVPAGLTALQALDRRQEITTRYGGRFVQSIGGVEGSLAAHHDWFFFVNGREADRGAAEVRLRAGDVEWWDYRSWRGAAMSVPVVAGAYPHPFVDGTTSVTCVDVGKEVTAKLAAQVHGVVGAKQPKRNYIVVSRAFAPQHVAIRRFRSGALLELGTAIARRLAADPAALRYRYGTAG
jgi:Domain of unknown function (DUF4430)